MEKNKKIIIASGIVSVMVLFIGIAFAALASNLNISFGNVTQNALTWNVGFKGSSVTPTQEGSSNTGLSCGTATVTPSTVTISDSTLSKPGDKCTYPLVIENKGDIAANLSAIAAAEPTGYTCTITNNSTMVCGNITYKLVTTSGTALATGITINKQEEYSIQLVVTYSGEELNSTGEKQSDAKFTLTYSQIENRTTMGSSRPIGVQSSTKCKRATTLHTEECKVKYTLGCYATGYTSSRAKGTTTITYGSLGTSGTLAVGDAFDCDVNGDGTYDAESERFYYVSGLDGDNTSDYAVLIYYTSVSAGVANNTATFAYDSANTNYNGPRTAYLQLPTTTQWSNVSLSNKTRQIYNEQGTTINEGVDLIFDEDSMNSEPFEPQFEEVYFSNELPKFTYTDRAARILSHKEINAACNITVGNWRTGELDSCEFLLEHTLYATDTSNTPYGWWLETTESTSSRIAYYIVGNYRENASYNAESNFGVRPAIEVLKTDIDY